MEKNNDAIDTANAAIAGKISACRDIIHALVSVYTHLRECGMSANIQQYSCDDIEEEFLACAYAHDELKLYHRAMQAVNPCMRIDEIMINIRCDCDTMRTWLVAAHEGGVLSISACEEFDDEIEEVLTMINNAVDITYKVPTCKKKSRVCECGSPMRIVPELAEMHCDICGKVKTISGSASEAAVAEPKVKGGKEIIRHFKFWMERLQAIEKVTFSQELVDKIMYVCKRDKFTIAKLTVGQIRTILKDPKVGETKYNDHAPALIKRLGGPSPPIHTYDDLEVTKSRFIRVMALHDQLSLGAGNKPYYPHFIYKILEEQHRGDKEKLRTLEYIHMQSQDTVVKNDLMYQKICALANDPGSGLVYRPTRILR